MTCSYCQLAGCCSGIGACTANQKYLKAYLQRHPGKIVSGNLARQICNLGKQEEDARKLKRSKNPCIFLQNRNRRICSVWQEGSWITTEIRPL